VVNSSAGTVRAASRHITSVIGYNVHIAGGAV
jgi:hypothetical protein